MMQLLLRLEHIEHAKFRTMMQAMIAPDKGTEAFEEYVKVAFPYQSSEDTGHSERAKRILSQEAQRGPLRVTPLSQPRRGSRLREQRLREREAMYSRPIGGSKR